MSRFCGGCPGLTGTAARPTVLPLATRNGARKASFLANSQPASMPGKKGPPTAFSSAARSRPSGVIFVDGDGAAPVPVGLELPFAPGPQEGILNLRDRMEIGGVFLAPTAIRLVVIVAQDGRHHQRFDGVALLEQRAGIADDREDELACVLNAARATEIAVACRIQKRMMEVEVGGIVRAPHLCDGREDRIDMAHERRAEIADRAVGRSCSRYRQADRRKARR